MKPLMRGYIPQAALVLAIGACALLISQSQGSRELISNLVYSASLIGLYGISALYHTPLWGQRAYSFMRRLDHAAIFLLIAGSATPICLFGVRGELGDELVILVWFVAMIGILITLFWSRAPNWVRAMLYVIAGWLVFPYFPQIKSSLGITNMLLLILGGATYTIGALIYALKRPNPFPHIFGYHEIFHILVVIASAFHFTIIYNLTT